MSSFIVENKTINRILTHLYYLPSDNVRRSFIYSQLKGRGFDLEDKDTDKVFTRLGQAMLKMNYDAVNYRYDGKAEAEQFTFKDEKAKLTQVLKSLQCFIYQCSEGSIPRRRLFKTLKDCEASLMTEIIETQTDYNSMEWG